jgi:hypothetical protein
MKSKTLLLAASAIASLALLTSNATAQVVDDPLHGYVATTGGNVNTDNGTISPINFGQAGVLGFGFFASPAPLTDDLNLIVLEPTSATPISVTGNVGAGTLFTKVGTTWTSGDLAAFLGFANSSPSNPFSAFASADTANPGGTPTSFNVFRADLGTQTENSLANSTMVDNIIGGMVNGALITAFSCLPTGIGGCSSASTDTVATAPSGVLMVVPGPVVGAGLPGLIAACGALVALARRRRQKTV